MAYIFWKVFSFEFMWRLCLLEDLFAVRPVQLQLLLKSRVPLQRQCFFFAPIIQGYIKGTFHVQRFFTAPRWQYFIRLTVFISHLLLSFKSCQSLSVMTTLHLLAASINKLKSFPPMLQVMILSLKIVFYVEFSFILCNGQEYLT